jgi:hypothetical protein
MAVGCRAASEEFAATLIVGGQITAEAGNGDPGWRVVQLPRGTWLYGAIPDGVTRVEAHLGSGVAAGCVTAVPSPVDRHWFVITVPATADVHSVDALGADGRIRLKAAGIGSQGGGPLTVVPGP